MPIPNISFSCSHQPCSVPAVVPVPLWFVTLVWFAGIPMRWSAAWACIACCCSSNSPVTIMAILTSCSALRHAMFPSQTTPLITVNRSVYGHLPMECRCRDATRVIFSEAGHAEKGVRTHHPRAGRYPSLFRISRHFLSACPWRNSSSHTLVSSHRPAHVLTMACERLRKPTQGIASCERRICSDRNFRFPPVPQRHVVSDHSNKEDANSKTKEGTPMNRGCTT